MQKSKSNLANLYVTLFRPALAPQGDLRSKNLPGQNILRITFLRGGGHFYAKNPKYKI
jgi:hypothetical protein